MSVGVAVLLFLDKNPLAGIHIYDASGKVVNLYVYVKIISNILLTVKVS